MNMLWQTRSARSFAKAWTSASQHMIDSLQKANETTFSTISGIEVNEDEKHENGKTGSLVVGENGVLEIEGVDEDWEMETSVHKREELGVGDYVNFTKNLTEADVQRFAVSSGDTNPLHLKQEFADETRFQGRIVHGTLVSGLISAALARLPGLTIYLSQDMKFLNPVRIGDRVTAHCEIVEDLGDKKYRLTTTIKDGEGETVVDGEAIVLIDKKPEKQ